MIADAICRFEKLQNNHSKYIFTTGTDEHGSKIQRAAQSQNASLQQYCDRVSTEYKMLFQKFNIDHTDFIRTSESRHHTAVKHFWVTKKTFYSKHIEIKWIIV